MNKLNYILGRNKFKGSKVTCPKLTSNQTYIVDDIYKDIHRITIDLKLNNNSNVVARVDSNDVFKVISE